MNKRWYREAYRTEEEKAANYEMHADKRVDQIPLATIACLAKCRTFHDLASRISIGRLQLTVAAPESSAPLVASPFRRHLLGWPPLGYHRGVNLFAGLRKLALVILHNPEPYNRQAVIHAPRT